MKRIVKNKGEAASVAGAVMGAISAGIDGGSSQEVIVRDATKKRVQEEKYHAMIGDFVRAGPFKYAGTNVDFTSYEYPLDTAKTILIMWFELDLMQSGQALKNPSRNEFDPVTKQWFQVRASSTKFGIKEAANFIEFLYAVGSECCIKWSERVKGYDDYPELSRG